jgi:hypothetical protein
VLVCTATRGKDRFRFSSLRPNHRRRQACIVNQFTDEPREIGTPKVESLFGLNIGSAMNLLHIAVRTIARADPRVPLTTGLECATCRHVPRFAVAPFDLHARRGSPRSTDEVNESFPRRLDRGECLARKRERVGLVDHRSHHPGASLPSLNWLPTHAPLLLEDSGEVEIELAFHVGFLRRGDIHLVPSPFNC